MTHYQHLQMSRLLWIAGFLSALHLTAFAQQAYNNEHPAWSPDGKRIAFASNRDGNNEIYLMNADGSHQQRLTRTPGRDAHPAWSPDGRKIAFQSPREGDGSDTNLYVMNADGTDQMQITRLKGFAGVPSWSPDGKKIVFQWEDEARAEKRWHIYVVNADGSNLQQLTNDAANNQVPNWSPDGRRILYYSDLTGKNQLYLMNPDGSQKTRLTNNSFNDHAAFWSRDGKRIVFISDRDGSREIYTMNADGTKQRRVTHGVSAYQANWSADGKRILFADVKHDHAEIFTLRADGSGLRRLTDGRVSAAGDLSLPVEEGYIQTDDGTRLFYQKVGRGAQTIILPGRLFTFDSFRQLADRFTIIAYDMRGRGRSDAIPDEQKAAKLGIHHDVSDLERIRQHFKVNKASLIGYSYLGLMVAMYAMEHPERVERIVQLGPVPIRFDTRYPDRLVNRDETGDPKLLAELRRWQKENYPATHPQEYCEQEWNYNRFGLVGDPAHVARLGGSQCAMPNEWPVNLAKHFEHSFVSVQKLELPKEKIAQLKVPVLTIHGTKDRNAPYGAGREWVMTFSHARLLTVRNAAHQAFAEYPEIVFPAIRTFLKGGWPENAEKVTVLEP